jgi:hypothetical protein
LQCLISGQVWPRDWGLILSPSLHSLIVRATLAVASLSILGPGHPCKDPNPCVMRSKGDKLTRSQAMPSLYKCSASMLEVSLKLLYHHPLS